MSDVSLSRIHAVERELGDAMGEIDDLRQQLASEQARSAILSAHWRKMKDHTDLEGMDTVETMIKVGGESSSTALSNYVQERLDSPPACRRECAERAVSGSAKCMEQAADEIESLQAHNARMSAELLRLMDCVGPEDQEAISAAITPENPCRLDAGPPTPSHPTASEPPA